MSKKIYSVVTVCFIFSIVTFVPGCVKKAPVTPLSSEESLQETEESKLSMKELKVEPPETYEPPLEEETIGGTIEKGPFIARSGNQDDQVEQYPAIPSSPQDKLERLSSLEEIRFEFDKYNIVREERDKLNEHAAWLVKNSGTFVKIQGHCDDRGTLDYNLALGERRANATKKYLIALGIAPSRISTISYGEERPLCFGRNESCWAQNRRAEFLIYGK